MDFPGDSVSKESTCKPGDYLHVGNRSLIPRLEDPLEKEMATHSSIFAWRISWTEKPGGLQPRDHKELDTSEQLSLPILALQI